MPQRKKEIKKEREGGRIVAIGNNCDPANKSLSLSVPRGVRERGHA